MRSIFLLFIFERYETGNLSIAFFHAMKRRLQMADETTLAYLTAAWSGEPDIDMELAAHYSRLAYEAGGLFPPLPAFVSAAVLE